jgi:hypothetical protein
MLPPPPIPESADFDFAGPGPARAWALACVRATTCVRLRAATLPEGLREVRYELLAVREEMQRLRRLPQPVPPRE